MVSRRIYPRIDYGNFFTRLINRLSFIGNKKVKEKRIAMRPFTAYRHTFIRCIIETDEIKNCKKVWLKECLILFDGNPTIVDCDKLTIQDCHIVGNQKGG